MKRILLTLWLILLPAFALAQTEATGTATQNDLATDIAELSEEVEDDRGFLTRLLERNLSGAGRSVVINGFDGALSSRATFTSLTVADAEGVWIEIRNGAIQWNRSALFGRRIEIQELSAEEILLPRLPQGEGEAATPEITEFQLPTLPVAIDIANIAVGRAVIGEPVFGEAATVSVNGAMRLGGGEGAAQLAIERVDGKRGTFTLDTAFNNETRNLRLNLTLDEAEGGLFANMIELYDRPSVTAEISGEGALSDFAADIRLATDGQERVTGRVAIAARAGEDGSPGTGFHAELTGDVASLLPPENRAFFGAQSQLLAEGWRGENGALSLPVLLVRTEALALTGSVAINDAGAPQALTLLLSLGEDAGATTLPARLPTRGEPITVQSGNLQISYDATQGEAWTARGRLGDLTQGGNRIGAVTLDGSGSVVTEARALSELLGQISLSAQGLQAADPGLQAALGDEIELATGFHFTPGNALELTGFRLTGQDYGLSGDLLADGLQSGITVSGEVGAAYEDLSRLSTLAGRPLSGRADATVRGLYTVLSRGFDGEATIEGTDISVGQEQLDRLLAGGSTIHASARRDETGIELREFTVNAQRLTAEAQGVINSDMADLRANLRLSSLTDADPQMAGSLSAEAVVSGAQGARRIALNGEAVDLEVGIPELDGALQGNTNLTVIAQQVEGGFQVEQLRLANPQLTAEGQGNFAPGALDADLQLAVEDLAVFGRGFSGGLEAQASVTDQDGTRFLDLTGTGEDLRLGQQDVDGALTGTTQLRLRASQTAEGVITVETLDLANQQMQATAEGTLGEGLADLRASVDIRSLAAFGRGWGGSLQAAGSLVDDGSGARRLEVDGIGRDLTLGQANVDGALGGETRLTVRAVERDGVYIIEQAVIDNPQAQVNATGTYGPGQTDLRGRVDLRDLSALGVGWSGSLVADAAFAEDGTGARRLTLDGTATDLALGQANLDAALAGQTQLAVRAVERDGVLTIEDATVRNPRLSVDAQGTLGGGQTDVTASVNAADLGFLGRGIGGALNATGRLIDDGSGARRITASGTAAGLSVGQEQADLLLTGQTSFDLAATQGPRGITIERLIARNPQLQVTADGSPQQLDVNATLNDLALFVPGLSGPATVQGTVAQNGQIVLDLAATAPGGTRAQIAGTIASDGSGSDLRITGATDAAIANPFLRVRSIQGPVNFDLRMQGPPSIAAVSGRITIPSAQLSDPKLGLRIEALSAAADIQNGLINLNASGNVAAGGRLTVTGPVDLRDGGPVLDLTATLDGVVLRDPNLYETVADGTVTVTGAMAEGPLIAGRVFLRETEFRIPSTGFGGARDIPDITHLGDRPPVRATRARAGLLPFPGEDASMAGLAGPPASPPQVAARFDLTIDAPNQVFVRGRGIDAELGGQIRLTGDARNVIPIGELQLIRGRVDLLGNRFDMTEGLIELQGSMIPVIRLVAETQQNGIVTRIIIDGEVRDPEISFESVPDLPEEEVLSQLLFGRGLESISALQAAQLANALAVLAGGGSAGIISGLRDSFGLDDLDLTTDADGDISVRAGKYLSRNLYTDVQVEADGTSKINLNLDVSDTLTARGSVASDGESTLGIFYERDY